MFDYYLVHTETGEKWAKVGWDLIMNDNCKKIIVVSTHKDCQSRTWKTNSRVNKETLIEIVCDGTFVKENPSKFHLE